MTARALIELSRAGLVAHRLRSALSILGIVAGVATVITAFAIGEGAKRQAMADIGSLGIRNVYVMPVHKDGASRAIPLVVARALDGVPEVTAVTAVRQAVAEVAAPAHVAKVPVVGVAPSALDIMNLRIARGRWLIPGDVRLQRRVAVLGADAAVALFGRTPSVGTTVEIHGAPFIVIGLLSSASRSPSGRFDPAGSVFVPLDVMPVKVSAADRGDSASAVIVQAREGADVERVARDIRARLARTAIGSDEAELVVPRALLAARLRSQRASRALLFAVGALALFISGVGIMNIMLASVSERTAEIGVRRAFGARRRDILRQFAAESVVLCSAGGLAGVPLGLCVSAVVAGLAAWPVAVSVTSLVTSVGMAVVTGVAFGLYPAHRAASITPVEAIRAGS